MAVVQRDPSKLHPALSREYWRTPVGQILLISAVCFCCPGMYNAITGIGGSGQLDGTVAANATVALFVASAASAITVVPPVFDLVGLRACLLIGGWTYPLYAGALLCYNHTQNSAFVIASGAILGVGASFLWVAQGAIMVSYPLPDQKGMAIALFWMVFNLGGGIGSFISFALNFHSNSGTVTDGTYGAFVAIMLFGWILCVFASPPHKVVRSDGTFAGPPPSSAPISLTASIKREYKNILTALMNWKILLLVPAFFTTNFYYSYQQNTMNGTTFTLRTRSINGAMYWIARVIGSPIIGMLLDLKALSRPQRALLGYLFIFTTGFAIWGGGFAFQLWDNSIGKKQWLDFSDAQTFVGPFWLYFFFGMFDAFWQSYCYWLLGALAESPEETVRYVGLFKTVQAIGGAVAWRINALAYPPLLELIINWALLGGALLAAIPTVLSITPSAVTDSIDEPRNGEQVLPNDNELKKGGVDADF